MQSLYAFHQKKEANKEVVRDQLADCYVPDLNVDELPDKEKLDLEKKEALSVFDNFFSTDVKKASETVSGDILKNVNRHLSKFHEMVSKDEDVARKQMMQELDRIFYHYLKLLLIAKEFAALDKADFKKVSSSKYLVVKGKNNFHQNPFVLAFEKFKSLELEVIKKNVSWENDKGELKAWYKDLKEKDEQYQEYQNLDSPSDEQHFEILLYLMKNVPFKKENIKLFMEGEDIYWSENKTIIKSLINKTIKSYDESNEEKYSLMEVNKNHEDDIPFFKLLYTETIGQDKEFEKIIAEKAKNWEIDRMATIDKIILKMALTEMINFPSIPTKVSINEYIELSKNYSTPKSKQFINGVLDVLAEDLVKEGTIKKSGRGLIDNK